MARYAAFLRGINVGGHRASKQQLCSAFETAGLRDVETFRASGNVIFSGDGQPETAAIEAALDAVLGYAAAVFVRSEREIRAIAAFEPFAPGQVASSAGKLQVTLLSAKPAAGVREAVLAHATDEDRLAFGARELYWLPSGNMRDSSLGLKALDRLLGVRTMRTKGTIEQIAAKYF